MKTSKNIHKTQFSYSLALVVGVGVALGASINNYLVGIIIALPIGVATYVSETSRIKNSKEL